MLDLYLPGNKRFSRTLDLYGPINPENSTFQYFGTKVKICIDGNTCFNSQLTQKLVGITSEEERHS